MPASGDRAVEVTRGSLVLALVPAAASVLSLSKVAQALAAGRGGGVVFPFPTGLPTLWTYVSLPGGPGGVPVGGPLSIAAFVPLFLVGLLVTSALEAGLLGSLQRRLDGSPIAFGDSLARFTLRMVGVNLVRIGTVLVALPVLVVPPIAFAVVIVLSYLVYGLPFEIVVRDVGVGPALSSTVGRALDGGEYATFGIGHLVGGALASVVLTGLVRNAGLVGVALGTLLVAVPAVGVACYGLVVFRDLAGRPGPD